MFSKHYQSELTYLRGMGRAFALANPAVAGLLADRGGDPDVERLLEGFAFLAARIRERLDDCVPEVAHDLAEVLLPHALRPLPAASIVEFTPVPGVLRGRGKVPSGSEIASAPLDGTRCVFRTTADLDLVPLSIQDVALDQALGAAPAIRIQLQAAQAVLPAVFHRDPIRFFVHGDLPVASTLLLWIARHLRGAEVRLPASRRSVELPPGAVRAIGFDPELPLLPWPRFAPPGYRALQEYFTLPQKFLFFEIRELAAAAAGEERFEIVLRFERPPDLPARIGRETLRLNCAPVVNLFAVAAEPIAARALGEEHLLRAAGVLPEHMEVFSIDSATSLAEGSARPARLEPFAAFGHGALGRDAAYYRVRRRSSVVDDGIDTFVALGRPLDAGAGPAAQTLSLDLTCTNRSLPARLRIGDVSQPTPASPTVARFKNVVAVTRPVRPPLGSELHWRLLAHLAAARATLADAEVLRSTLALYNLQARTDEQTGRANQLRVDGVREVRHAPARRLLGGTPVRGTRIALDLDEASFAGAGDAFLFACAVDELLAARTGLNAFCEVSARLLPSQREYAWPARAGGRPLV